MSAAPIPATCAARPTTPDGLVIPFANVQLADGGCDFRSHHNTRWLDCWRHGRCQVCGHPIGHPTIFLCGPRQLRGLLFDEPPVHPECARYVSVACPMVAGERTHYRTGDPVAHRKRGGRCLDPDCDCGGWVPTPGAPAGKGGDPAHAWYAVYASGYQLAAVPDDQAPNGLRITGGGCLPDQVLRVRQVSEPGLALWPWRNVPDWADHYRPPELADCSDERRHDEHSQ